MGDGWDGGIHTFVKNNIVMTFLFCFVCSMLIGHDNYEYSNYIYSGT